MKWTVVFLVVIEACSSAFASFVAYDYAVRDFGQPTKVLVRTPEFSAFILTIGIASTTTQSFYSWRINRLLGKRWLSTLIYVLAAIQMLCVTGVATGDSIITSFLDFQRAKPVRIIVMIWMTIAPITDLFIAGLLVWFLRRSRTGFRKTDSILNRLALLTVQTGAITAVAALLGLLLFLTVPDFFHLIFIFTLPEFYGVCMLASLNARAEWQSDLSGEMSIHPTSKSEIRTEDASRGAVQITRSVVTHNDQYELSARPGIAITLPDDRKTNEDYTAAYDAESVRKNEVFGTEDELESGSRRITFHENTIPTPPYAAHTR
ncbi:hypothetical protein DL93DRAFT_2085985 [Clavulina sp. PMI_390]|nr:hypothetical protein DL93DRAFT_2085985 [Clavulina sp. PMI_390]